MRCLICTHSDVKEINRALLERVGRRTGTVAAMAKKLGVSRQVLWRHRKEHLKLFISKTRPKAATSLEERAKELGGEADRLQMQIEAGVPKEQVAQALQALGLRLKALQLEGQLSGRLSGGRAAERSMAMALGGAAAETVLDDPDEAGRVEREFAEVVGDEQ
jgi:hypothetical protein